MSKELTEEQIEIAARHLCEIRGLEPNEVLRGNIKSNWYLMAAEIKDMNEVNQGMHKVEYSPVRIVSEETLKLLRELK